MFSQSLVDGITRVPDIEPVFTFRKQYVDDEGHSIKKALDFSKAFLLWELQGSNL